MKVKLLVVLVIAAAFAATGGSWKWAMPSHGSPHGSAPYKIAGWTWGDGPSSGQEQGDFRKELAHRSDDRDAG